MQIALIATHHCDYAANLARSLAARHRVLLVLSARSAKRQIAPDALAALRDKVTLRIVPHHYAPLQPLIAFLCARHVHSFAPDVVHVQEHPTRSMGLLARRLRGRYPLVTTVHDPRSHSGNDARAAQRFESYYERLRGLSDRLIVHGEALVAMLAETGIDRARIRSIMHGVLFFGRTQPPAARPVERDRVIFFGRAEAYKGLDTLLAAQKLWQERGSTMRLLVAGAGPEIAAHREELQRDGIELHEGRVPQDELAQLVGSSLAAVLPYHDATQSGVIASAFGAGRPVVATNVGALAEAVGEAGLIVPPGDPEALAAAVMRLGSEQGLVERLEKEVENRVAGSLGWDAIAADTEAVYKELTAE
tara:strand:+ start:7 stop:1092 length:1086 start_codon:yes stop_codon:yes gene_type:complete